MQRRTQARAAVPAAKAAARRSPPNAPRWLLPAAGALAIAVPLMMIAIAYAHGVALGFPLDDAWIHLQYARTLSTSGAFAYGPGEPATTGSTSVLFTLLEAAAFLVTSNEKAIGLALSVAAHVAFVIAFVPWASARLGAGWAALAVALLACDGRFGELAASGMETSLFLACMAAAFLARLQARPLVTAVALGVAVWARPEGLVLAGVFALDSWLEQRARAVRWDALLAFAVLAAGWLVFNHAVGGEWLPQTMAAKAAAYGRRTLAQYAGEDVLPTLGGAWLLLLPFFALAVWRELRALLARSGHAGPRAEVGWALALVLAYAISLRYSHRFNRYLLPVLPAYAIASVAGLRDVLARVRGRAAASRWAAVAGVLLLVAQMLYFWPALEEYGRFVHYHRERHEAAGRWLAANTPPQAVVATHDVGAIAFYSHRRVVDLAGLVTPEVVPHLGQRDFLPFLDGLLARRGVTRVAVLENWMSVRGAAPLWEATREPEVLHIYPWQPGVTHLAPPTSR